MIVKEVEFFERELLDEVDDDIIAKYCEEYNLCKADYSNISFADLADAVYHHDFDIEKFLEYINYRENK